MRHPPALIQRTKGRGIARRPVNFAREIRPILSDNCFACHGPDHQKRKAGLRLDTSEEAFGTLESGNVAIVRGKPDESELIVRIENDDPDLRMPPRKSGKHLAPGQIAVLRRWIEQGATMSTHWAFQPPHKPALPAVKKVDWPITEIDRFILARLEAEGLSPAPEADKTDPDPPRFARPYRPAADARGGRRFPGRLVRRMPMKRWSTGLLDSPRYGEHMARFWLDAARYGDTHGLHLDNYREIWPYREWVIRAFNANKPFDRFIVEQLAGDLLPNPTPDQIDRHRLQPLPRFNQRRRLDRRGGLRSQCRGPGRHQRYRLSGADDRLCPLPRPQVRPDPQKEYYQLFAFFNNIDGPPMDGNAAKWAPIAQVPTQKQAMTLRADDARIAVLRRDAHRDNR